jgi:hypothetical protein
MGAWRTYTWRVAYSQGKMLCNPAFVSSFKDAQSLAISFCENWISRNRLEAVLCFKRRKEALTTEQKHKEPLSYSHFDTSLDHVQKYLDCLKSHGIKWIGAEVSFSHHVAPNRIRRRILGHHAFSIGFYAPEETRHSTCNWSNFYSESSPPDSLDSEENQE